MEAAVQHRAPTLLNTHHALKLLALILMTIDHVGAYLYPEALWLRAVGRLCVPIWFFLIGHAPTYNMKRDTVLWAAALVLISPLLGPPVFALNNLVTIILCILLLRYIEKHGMLAKHPLYLCFVCVLLAPVTMVLTEYGTLGLLYALMGYAVRSQQMDWRRGKLVTLVALAAYVPLQCVMWNFSPVQMGFIGLGSAVVTFGMMGFTWRPVRMKVPPVLARATVWLSRHSLQYYVVHRVLLQALGVVTGVSSSHFHWFEI